MCAHKWPAGRRVRAGAPARKRLTNLVARGRTNRSLKLSVVWRDGRSVCGLGVGARGEPLQAGDQREGGGIPPGSRTRTTVQLRTWRVARLRGWCPRGAAPPPSLLAVALGHGWLHGGCTNLARRLSDRSAHACGGLVINVRSTPWAGGNTLRQSCRCCPRALARSAWSSTQETRPRPSNHRWAAARR